MKTLRITKQEEGQTIYLNSNECVVNRPVNILDKTKGVKVDYGNLTWQTSFGSTATKLFIYGPFDCWDATGTKINTSWRTQKTSDIILSDIEAVYNGNYDSYMHKFGPESKEALGELRTNSRAFGMFCELINVNWKMQYIYR